MALEGKKIFGLIDKNSGLGFHRIHLPLLLMHEPDTFITNAVNESDFEKRKPDAIYYNRKISDEVLRLQSKYHFKVVVDMDDYWHLDPHHVLFKYSKQMNDSAHHIKHMRIADAVTTTHERLAEMIYPYNKNVILCPNAIPTRDIKIQDVTGWDNEFSKEQLFATNRTQSAKGHIRVFWQGSITHEADINILRKTIKKLDKDKFLMVMAGFHPEKAEWFRMANCFTDYQRMPWSVFLGTTPYEYYKNYQYADVAVVPLLSTKFNSFKSNLKILEAAHVGIPVIASNVHPYKNMPGVCYVDKAGDWFKWLNTPMDELKEHAKVLSAFCKENYDFKKINNERMRAFE